MATIDQISNNELGSSVREKLNNVINNVNNFEGALSVSDSHIFVDNTARDAYFTSNPTEKVTGVFISVGAGFQQWSGTAWVDKSAILKGDKGDTGATVNFDDAPIYNLYDTPSEMIQDGTFSELSAVSSFSGWGGYIGVVDPFQKLELAVMSRNVAENTITQVKVSIHENNHLGTLVAEKTVNVSIAPGELEYVEIKLDDVVDTETPLYFIYRCNKLVSRWGLSTGILWPYLPADGVAYPTFGYTTGGSMTTFTATLGTYNFYLKLYKYGVFPNTQENVNDIESKLLVSQKKPVPMMVLASKLYVAVGRELNVWYKSLAKIMPGQNLTFYTEYANNEGRSKERSFRLTPTATGTKNLKIQAVDFNGDVIDEVVTQINNVSKTAGSGSGNIIVVGDSLVDNLHDSTFVNELATLFSTDGGFSPTFVGLMGKTNKHEGVSGRTTLELISAATRINYIFTVSGVSVSPSYGGQFTNNGSTWQVLNWSIVAGSGTILCIRVSGSTTPSGNTLTKIYGNGDATITFSANVRKPDNSFWDFANNRNDFQKYMTTYGFSGNIDYFVFQLGVNDYFYTVNNVAVNIGYMKSIFSALLSETYGYPNCKIVISLEPISAITLDAFANHYYSLRDWLSYHKNMYNFYQTVIDEFDNGNYHANISVCQTYLWVDREFGYPTTTEARSARDVTSITVQNNFVHPSEVGMKQMADAVYSHLRGLLT